MVLASMVESSVHELQDPVSTVESLATPVVQLVLTNEASTVALKAVGSDDILLSHLHPENGVSVVHSILCAEKSVLGSNAGLGSESGSEGRTGVLHHLASVAGSLASLLDGTIVGPH